MEQHLVSSYPSEQNDFVERNLTTSMIQTNNISKKVWQKSVHLLFIYLIVQVLLQSKLCLQLNYSLEEN